MICARCGYTPTVFDMTAIHLHTLYFSLHIMELYSQYPIFPWVLQDYVSSSIDLEDESVYRWDITHAF